MTRTALGGRLLQAALPGVCAPIVCALVVGSPGLAQGPAEGAAGEAAAPPVFEGEIGRTVEQSRPAFLVQQRAPKGAPNILLVLTDDIGFGAVSTFGGPIPTPALDRLAESGLRYNRFHTTAMCSPTRAALLTGRNAHAVGYGAVIDLSTGFPGYWSILPESAATVADVLKQQGYGTAFFGKHHNVPNWQASAAGPFDLWPTGLGFDYFYGFIGGDTDQFRPKLYRGISNVEDPHAGHENYILDRDLADDAIDWIHNLEAADPDKPFFLYFAPGSGHAPHQAPEEWIERFRGQYDAGWDVLREQTFARQKRLGVVPADAVLTPRPEEIPAWNSLSADQQRVYSRMMEAYAAMVAFQDAQIGRILSELERMGKLDNTLVLFIEGDNGASPEGKLGGTLNEIGTLANGVEEPLGWLLDMSDEMGGPDTYQLFPVGWAWATDAPFQWTKRVASHLGGTRNGLVVSWPEHIRSRGEVRGQFHHVIDIMPTILEAAGLEMPESVDGTRQIPLDGVSMAYSFADADAPGRRETQYFEMLGNRAIYHDGWMANTRPVRAPWKPKEPGTSVDDYEWELYHLEKDFSQSRDLSARYPAKLADLRQLFERQASDNQVYPIDDREGAQRAQEGRAAHAQRRSSFIYWGGDIHVAQFAAPPTEFRSFELIADLVIPEEGGEGVLVANGSQFGGWSLFLNEGRPAFHYSYSQQPDDQFRFAASEALPPGSATLKVAVRYKGRPGPGRTADVTIRRGDEILAEGQVPRTILVPAGLGETFDIGQDTGVAVTEDAQREFNGGIRKVEVLVTP